MPLPPFPLQVEPARLDWQDDTPVARDFGDVYFSRGVGLAETAHVFVDGNDLRARFAAGGFHRFAIGETGFGTGLNFLAAADAFLRHAPSAAVLHYVSVEKFPLTAADLAQAHAHWPELATLAADLQANWPPACAGFHHRVLGNGRIRLTLLWGDAAALLPRLEARIDAWFLDGFAPAKNADLWTEELFAGLARLSAAGTTFATFTAAGLVRRGLVAAGFEVRKVPGYGRKRDMLRGVFHSGPPATGSSAPGTAAVIGGGLAGCAAARALAERGWQVALFERHDALAAETSGNLQGVVYPKFSVHETAQNRWYRDSYLHALARLPQLLGAPDGERWDACGLLQVAMTPTQEEALQAIATSGRWPASMLRRIDAAEAAACTGIPLERGGLWFSGAGWVHPPALCRALSEHPRIALRHGHTVRKLDTGDHKPAVDGETFDAVIVANALAAREFPATSTLPLRRVRGQVTHAVATPASTILHAVICHAGYISPARQGLHSIGATFGPRDHDPAVRDDDHADNLGELAAVLPALHAALQPLHIAGGRTGFRVQSPDYLPLIGAVPGAPGTHILAALGAKGIAFALLGAEILATRIAGEPLPVDSDVAAALDPGRFARRSARVAAHRNTPRTGATT
ncbi:MAG: bifunctional tRNA (5-methylaminomethyl-2-thiouridine)(34)-methyltransferase MnmD/FAD-dependent 5-carboxymethylaminomethyl-2-thiouridine(34) oxidoreductase MnmC [Pseudomonadota bacterium]